MLFQPLGEGKRPPFGMPVQHWDRGDLAEEKVRQVAAKHVLDCLPQALGGIVHVTAGR